MLPAKGPWPHPYYELPDAFVEVAFTDAEGNERHVRVRHKTLGDGPPLVLVHGLMTTSYSWRYVIEALSQGLRQDATMGVAALVLLVPMGLGLLRVLARVPSRR